MCKTFFADISKTMHHPASMTAADFSDCYDRSAHPPQSIALQAFRMPRKAAILMLRALQVMQFCLRTGFGESTQTYGGSEDDPLAGLGQGNGAAPPSFAVLSALVVNAYKRMGHGARLTSAYMARLFVLAAVLYVDDGDWFHLGSSVTMTDEELIAEVQQATTDAGHLVQATGGALKQEKCSAYVLSYTFVNGAPRLKRLDELPAPRALVERKDGTIAPAHLVVPQPSGEEVPIATLDVSTPAKMLDIISVQMVMGLPTLSP